MTDDKADAGAAGAEKTDAETVNVEQSNAETPDAESKVPTAPSADAKARFKEALDRKNAARTRTTESDVNTGAVHGSETTGPVQKMFRRKSG